MTEVLSQEEIDKLLEAITGNHKEKRPLSKYFGLSLKKNVDSLSFPLKERSAKLSLIVTGSETEINEIEGIIFNRLYSYLEDSEK